MRKRVAPIGLATLFIAGAVIFWYLNLASSEKNSPSRVTLPEPTVKNNAWKNMTVLALAKDRELLRAAISSAGTRAIMEKLVAETKGGTIADCHQEAHEVGRAGYALFKEKAMRECDSSCHSGCYHGAMETLLNKNGTENLPETIHAVCQSFPTSFGRFECLHGVGHGALAYLDYDLPAALADCKRLANSFEQSSCYGGVFMENILTAQGLGAKGAEHETRWVKKDDPLFPCDGVDNNPEIQYQCYQMQTSRMLELFNYDFDRVSAECKKVPLEMRSVCFKSFGRDAAGQTLRDPRHIVIICDKAPEDYRDECLGGGLNVIVDFWGEKLGDQAAELCRVVTTERKEACYKVLALRIPGIFTDKETRKLQCGYFEPEYQNLCEVR